MKFRTFTAFILLAALFMATRPGTISAQISPSMAITGVSPTLLKTNTLTTVKVSVKNQSVSTYARMEVSSSPSGWSTQLQTTDSVYIGGGSTKTFKIDVTPDSREGNWTIGLKLYVNDIFGDTVTLTGSFNLDTLSPPQTFYMISPDQNAVIENNLYIEWSRSASADTYRLTIAKYFDGRPTYPAQFTYSDLTNNFYYIDNINAFEKGARYEIKVTATNAVGSVENSDGPRAFTIKGYDSLGLFNILTPTTNLTTTLNPLIQWEPSPNAISYRLYVFPEKNGSPDTANPVREKTVTTTIYSYEDPPLSAGTFFVSVVAVGQVEELAARNSPVRFKTSGLTTPFNLIAPANSETKLPFIPEFRWEVAPGARKYRFTIYELADTGNILWHTGDVSPAELFVTYYLPANRTLIWGRTYSWYVDAIRDTETRRNEGGPRVFTTSLMQPFDLLSPAPEETGVDAIPVFTWGAVDTVSIYYVEVAPTASNGEPILSQRRTSSGLTDTTWTYSFAPLELGNRYSWRVGASDGKNVITNYGGWQTFTVNPFQYFELISPTNLLTGVSPTGVLRWEPCPGATSYRVYILLNHGPTLPPIDVPGNVTTLDLGASGHPLNSLTEYVWTVEARTEGASRFAAGPWIFGTTERDEITSCDFVDQLLGRQYFTAADFVLSGIASNIILDSAFLINDGMTGSLCSRPD